MDRCGNERLGWEKEQQVNKDAAKAIREFRKDPDGVSKKTEEAIKRMGMRPDQKLVTKLAAQVVAYRQESRGDKGDSMTRGCQRRCAQWWWSIRSQALRENNTGRS
jgi:hypothetical protein